MKAYKDYVQYKYKGGDYLLFLKRIGYAEDPDYIIKVHQIAKIRTEEQDRLMEFQKTPEFKIKARERYKIEAKNAELKHVYGYDRAESYGLYSMQMQGAITIFAANIKRILKLI